MWRYAVPAVVFVVLAALLAVGLTRDPTRVPSPFIDNPAPAFTLPDLHDPDSVVSNADFAGEVMLFNVWASWCIACRDEHPLFVDLVEEHGIPILGLNYKDERPDALAWLERFGDPYLRSGHDFAGDVGIDWGVYGVPETFVIDRQGKVRYKHIGAIDESTVNDTLLPLIRRLRDES
jgi:cytochrome c biogenesis protein CcmG, thiol:disulfide interchange protein DsbE